MISPVQQAISNRNKKIVIGAGVIFAGLWAMLVAYLLMESRKDYSVAQPGIVAVHAPSPTAINAPTARFRSTNIPPILHQVNTPQKPAWSLLPATPMTSTSMHIHQTSDASVQNLGSGMGVTNAATNGNSGTSGRGIQSSGIAYSGMIYIPTAHNAVTAVGAGNANYDAAVLAQADTPEKNLKTTNADPDEPFLDPIGDVTWALLSLLALAYAYVVYNRRKSTTPDA